MANRFIFLTGDIVNSNTYAFLENEKKPYISKPFTIEEFLSAFRSAVKTLATHCGGSRA
jgi:DNA-binding response OmpR family regulator